MNCNNTVRAVIFAVVISSAAEAEAFVIGGTIPTPPLAFTTEASDYKFFLPKFDSHLGTLNGVSLTLRSFVDNSFYYAVVNPNPDLTVSFTRYLNLGDTKSGDTLLTATTCGSPLAVCDLKVTQSRTYDIPQNFEGYPGGLPTQGVSGAFNYSSGFYQFIGNGLATDTMPFYFSAHTDLTTSNLRGGAFAPCRICT